jgi:endonuclease/exonuclease/phosphatase family metal-dependent hydrolase
LTVWNLHFDHRGAVARERSAELIAARVRARPGPHLVLGDTNCGEDSRPLAALRTVGLRDTYRDQHQTATVVGTFHGFRGGTAGAKIDYVLADAGLVTVAAGILAEPLASGRWPSDHHGVVAEVVFRAP